MIAIGKECFVEVPITKDKYWLFTQMLSPINFSQAESDAMADEIGIPDTLEKAQ
jgi:hypothetical protein